MTPPIPAEAIDALRRARSVVVVTGAGVSAESGIPTPSATRPTPTPSWANHDPADLATPEAFARDPVLVTKWYEWRLAKCAACRPNPAHLALARLEAHVTERAGAFTLLTQNVDGLHQQAGSRNVHELHGTIRVWRCLSCAGEHPLPSPPFAEHPLRCSRCADGVLRPGVVWFGEALPDAALQAGAQAIESCDLFMSIGTSAVVYPAAAFAHEARARGALVMEINRDPTPLTKNAGLSLLGKSGEILPSLVDEAFGEG